MPRVIEAITPLAPDDLIFHALTGMEALSTLFDFTVTLVSKQKDIAPKALLGKDITLAIETEQDGPKRHVSGLFTRFAFTGRHKQYHLYQARLKPWLWLASRRSDSKIFQNKRFPTSSSRCSANTASRSHARSPQATGCGTTACSITRPI